MDEKESRMIDDPDNIEEPDTGSSLLEIFDREPPWHKWPPPGGFAKRKLAICYAIGRHPNPQLSIDPIDAIASEITG